MDLCKACEGGSGVGEYGGCGPLVGLFLVGVFKLVDLGSVGGAGIAGIFDGGVKVLVLVGGLEFIL